MASTYLSRTPSSAGNRRTLTISAWIKLAGLGTNRHIICEEGAGTEKIDEIKISNTDVLRIENYNDSGSDYSLITSQVFRDPNAWYHLVVAFDSTQATSSDRIKVYLNGSQITSFSTETYPSQNHDFYWNSNLEKVGIGADTRTPSNYFNGSMAHVHFIDGTAYDASAFGETDATTGIWKPKTAPSVTYGTNGFFLKFENSGSMGTDSSGNGNNFTVNGTLTQTVDTPSNVFATWNPLSQYQTVTVSNGNTSALVAAADPKPNISGTLYPTTGKWYWEGKASNSGVSNWLFGIRPEGMHYNQTNIFILSGTYSGIYYYGDNGQKYVNGSASSYGNSYTTNDIISVALDLDNGYIYFAKNGTWQNSGDPTSGATGTGGISITNLGLPYTASLTSGASSQAAGMDINFGNGYFGTSQVASAGTSSSGDNAIWEYDCPTGYYSLCTKNINTYG